MSTSYDTKTNPLADAVDLSGFLCSWLIAPDLATLERMEEGFAALPLVIEALPPTAADAALMCYLRNRACSTRRLKEGGDFAPAAYQLREMHLKLAKRLRELA